MTSTYEERRSHHQATSLNEEQRARGLERVLASKRLTPEGHIDKWVQHMTKDWHPDNGAKVVARAWVDPDFRELLLTDAQTACEQFGYTGPQGEYTIAIENTADIHNVIVCSLCSCTHWPLLGIQPEWYKSVEYRARLVREPRKVLSEMGTSIPENIEIKVWDTTAESRFFVLPVRPSYTEGWSEEELAKIVTKDVLIGAALL